MASDSRCLNVAAPWMVAVCARIFDTMYRGACLRPHTHTKLIHKGCRYLYPCGMHKFMPTHMHMHTHIHLEMHEYLDIHATCYMQRRDMQRRKPTCMCKRAYRTVPLATHAGIYLQYIYNMHIHIQNTPHMHT